MTGFFFCAAGLFFLACMASIWDIERVYNRSKTRFYQCIVSIKPMGRPVYEYGRR